MLTLGRCSRIICVICSQGYFTALKRILPSLRTFSVTQALTPPEFILFQPERNTVSVWKICNSYYEKSCPNRRQKHNLYYVVHKKIGKLPIVFAALKSGYDSNIAKKELVKLCKRKLPEYAQPIDFIFIDKLPLTPIGKIDYRILEKQAEELDKK